MDCILNGARMEALVLETVTGPIGRDGFTRALAHEHLFADFLGPDHPDYCRVDWEEVRAACVDGLGEVRGEGVDLLVECTGIGIGRNVHLLGAVSAATSVSIVCATGIYKALRPPELADASPEELAALFADELTVGIEDTGVRAGFIKLATSDSGPTEEETTIHRAGAMAAVEAGAAIALHSPQAGALRTVLRTLEGEGFAPARLVWVHAQESSLAENLEMASRGVTISLDAIGTSNDGEMLDRIEALAETGGQVVLSSDNTFVVHPPELAYERDITYLDRRFAEMVEACCGADFLDAVRRDNVLRAYGHPLAADR
jgi:phosphotriesterase-related protein